MKIFKNFSKSLKANKISAVSLVAVSSILLSGFYIDTAAVLSDSAKVTVTNSSDIWVVPSMSPSAPDFQSAKINWTKAGSYTSYTFQYSTSSSFASVTTRTVNGLTTTVTGLKSNTTYYFRVRPATSPTGTWETASVLLPDWSSVLVGTGWNGYVPAAAGDANKDGARDFLAIQKVNGNLWMYPGWNSGGVSSTGRVQVGTGYYPLYTRIFGAGDWNGDGREDFMATDSNGQLFLYPANQTFNGMSSYGARISISGGWNPYTQVGGAGELTGDSNVDLIAVDSGGSLRIYPGASGNGFGTAFSVSGGWARFSGVVGIGDLDKDGKNDLLAIDGTTGEGWFYGGTGVPNTTAFKAGVKIPNMIAGPASEYIGSGDMDNDGFSDLTETAADGNMYFWKGADIATALGF
jgi:hypothetical protein